MRQLHDHATLIRAVRADPNGEAATTGKVRTWSWRASAVIGLRWPGTLRQIKPSFIN